MIKTFVLYLPWPRPPLRSNDKLHWRPEAAKKADIRDTVFKLAKEAKIPRGRHLTVTLHYAPGSNRRMDSHNLHPTVKSCVDALAKGPRSDWVGLELVPDDTDEWVTIKTPVIHRPPVKGPRCWLTIEVDLGQ